MVEHDDKNKRDEHRKPHERAGAEDDSGNDEAGARERHDADAPFELEPIEDSPLREGAPAQKENRGVPLEEQFTCPNCNALMPDEDALVCLRCGFDIKSLNVQRTRIEKPAEVDEDEDEADEEELGTETPICQPGRGDLWLPTMVGGLSAALLVAGYLAGAPGLYPELRATEPPALPAGFMDRLTGIVSFTIIIALLTGCGLAGLWMLKMSLSRPLGDVKLAAARIAAIVVAIRLVTFINLGEHRQTEFMAESVLQAALFIGLSIVVFAIKPRTALMLGGFALITYLTIWITARLIVLATW